MTSVRRLRFRQLGLTVTIGCLAGAVSAGPACKVQSIFTCTTDEECVTEAGVGAICETAQSFCQLPDPACQLGLRWHDRADGDLAGKCLEDTLLTGTGTGVAATMGSSDGTDDSPGTTPVSDSSGGGSTGGGTTLPDPSTTGDPGDTGMSTGAAQDCDGVFGTAPAYMYCTEAPGTCSFVAMLGMTSSCNDICGMFGATCASADLNDVDPCTSTGMSTCDDATSNDAICTCNLP